MKQHPRVLRVAGKSPGRTLALLLAMTGVLLTTGVALRADVIEMYDGRRFEGKIFEETSTVVRIDAMVRGVRVQLGLPRREISRMEKLPLPEGFFEATAKADTRLSKPGAFPADANLYVEVPIVGNFGVQVIPAGVRKCLSYAAANKIPHVVFVVDSQGGERDAAKQIYDLLARYSNRLRYHAVVRDSLGVAMAVTIWCENVFVLPGANLGGIYQGGGPEEGNGNGVLLSQTAHEIGQEAEKHGWPAPLVRAMVDPAESVYAWRDDSGKVMTAARMPSSVPRDNITVHDRPESVLTLTRAQAVDLGLARAFSGSVDTLGAELKLAKWTRESDYGQKTMLAEARQEYNRMRRAADRKEKEIARLIERRETTKKYIERNLTLAHEWDPDQSATATYDRYKDRGEKYWGGPIESTITRPRWRELTDYTIAALTAAYKGVQSMKKLEDQARDFGIEPLYQEGELEKLEDDIEVKVTLLKFWRERKTSAT